MHIDKICDKTYLYMCICWFVTSLMHGCGTYKMHTDLNAGPSRMWNRSVATEVSVWCGLVCKWVHEKCTVATEKKKPVADRSPK